MRCPAMRALSDLHISAEGDVEGTEQEERVEKEAIPAVYRDQLMDSAMRDKDMRSTHSFA